MPCKEIKRYIELYIDIYIRRRKLFELNFTSRTHTILTSSEKKMDMNEDLRRTHQPS